MSKRTCSAPGCDKPLRRVGLCSMHASRMRRVGVLEPQPPPCVVCGSPTALDGRWNSLRKYCTGCRERAAHGPIRDACLGCGGPMPQDRRRKYCTPSCRFLAHKYGDSGRPTSKPCAVCAEEIDLTERMKDGTLRRPSYTVRCDTCQAKVRPTKYGMTAAQVAERDGPECRWCREDVDLALVGSRSKWAPSVDHIIPWSKGGTNAPDNLQLMHRVCNAKKGVQLTQSPVGG